MSLCCCSLPRSCCATCSNNHWFRDDPLPPTKREPIGEISVKITLNKDEILRDLVEIRKAEELMVLPDSFKDVAIEAYMRFLKTL